MFRDQERRYVEKARIARLATADADGHPHVVPVCYAFVNYQIVTPIDEKPQQVSPEQLRRSQDISENPSVALIVDHYTEDWSKLGWVQVRGSAVHCTPSDPCHTTAIAALREKYEQYEAQNLEERPLIMISPEAVRSWGCLKHPDM